jgi:hypothetical protein
MLRRLRKAVVAPVLRSQADRLLPAPVRRRSPRLEQLAAMARWWRAAGRGAPRTPDRESLYELVLTGVAPRMYLEFGVAAGASMRWWVRHVRDESVSFFGFDTFEGIPEAWGSQPAGSYSAGGTPPDVGDDRVRWVVGTFDQTLPGFVADLAPAHPLVLHLDADLYSSTAEVLRAMRPLLQAGDVLVFDELLDVGTADHEFAAFRDVADETGLRVQVLGAVRRGPQVAVRVEA